MTQILEITREPEHRDVIPPARASLRDLSATQRIALAKAWAARLNAALSRSDYDAASRTFAPHSYWRDLLALTWDIRTFAGRPAIAAGLADTHRPSGMREVVLETDDAEIGELGPFGPSIDAFVRFRTAAGVGRGFVRLLPDPDDPDAVEAFTLLTTLHELEGFPERTGAHRHRETSRPDDRGDRNWLDRRQETSRFIEADPEVVVIGAGQAGLAVAARLGQLSVPTLVVDRMARVGDNWRHRYHSLTLHNEICTNHLPYMPFPETWPIYLPKDMLAGWLEAYAMSMELNVWTSTAFLGGEYDEVDGRWTVRVQTEGDEVRVLRPSHVVLAVGASGLPNMPAFSGLSSFEGQVMHSSRPTDDLDVRGKAAVVVGAGTSAHDIAQDLHMRGAKVTMLQRSPTTVVGLEPASVRAYEIYRRNEHVRRIEDTDLMSAAIPFDLVRQLHGPLSRKMQEEDAALLEGLRRADFWLDNGEDDTGFFMKLIRSFGGYYINVGASDLIVDGKIAIRHGGIDRVGPRALALSDGTTLPADLLVLATGYKPLQEAVRALFGNDVADRVGPIWGLGDDNEMRNMWRRTAQPGLFVAGGTLTMCRIYSKYTALLIKASLEGLAPKSAPAATH